jgi:hypothetical protein
MPIQNLYSPDGELLESVVDNGDGTGVKTVYKAGYRVSVSPVAIPIVEIEDPDEET